MEMKFGKTVKFVVINLLENLDDGNETDSHLPSGRALYIYIREVSYHFPCHATAWGPEKTEARFIHNLKWHGLVHNLRMVITNRTNFVTCYCRFEDTERCLVIVV